jgi:hypothetical protein
MAVAKKTGSLYTGKIKQKKHIRTQAELVTAFRDVYGQPRRFGKIGDGKREMATWFRVSHQCVCNWFIVPFDGKEPPGIPTGYHARLMLWAAHHGYIIHPETFGPWLGWTPLGQGQLRGRVNRVSTWHVYERLSIMREVRTM